MADALLQRYRAFACEHAQVPLPDATSIDLALHHLSELLIQPAWTRPVILAFRPWLLELVARVTAEPVHDSASLPRLEAVVVMLSVVLPQLPQALPQASRFLARSASPFERLLVRDGWTVTTTTTEPLLAILRAVLLLLSFRPAVFSRLWNYTPVLRLACDPHPPLAWVCIRLLGVLYALSDQQMHVLLAAALAGSDADPSDVALCNDMQHVLLPQASDRAALLTPVDPASDECLPPPDWCSASHVSVGGILLSLASSPSPRSLVPTPRTSAALAALALRVAADKPVLLEGGHGVGKTCLVRELAAMTGRADSLITVHIGDQTDAKALLGSYVCTEVPGEFRWQASALSQAVQQGRWILIEDLHLAPSEVLAIFTPLLEDRRLFIPGRSEVLPAADGFQIFATRVAGAGLPITSSTSPLWSRVVVPAAQDDELAVILAGRYPQLSHSVTQRCIATFTAVRAYAGTAHRGRPLRVPGLRDLLKWCDRIVMLTSTASHKETVGMLTAEMREQAFVEAADCFAAAADSPVTLAAVVAAIAAAWEVSPERRDVYISSYKPAVASDSSGASIGRVRLPRRANSDEDAIRAAPSSVFAPTRHALSLLEQLAVCVTRNEPALLVGETGCGKTSVIQHLAALSNHRLVVVNLNEQSEAADLIGGFKPVDLRLLCTPLMEQFEQLFARTWKVSENERPLQQVRERFAAKQWLRLIKLWRATLASLEKRMADQHRRSLAPDLRQAWRTFAQDVARFDVQHEQVKNSFAFRFVEGALVSALRSGDWLLLDEVNLASPETLESLASVLEASGSVALTELGHVDPIPRHADFRLFANMNPPTDVGKRELPAGLRARFTELYMPDVMHDRNDLTLFIASYLRTVPGGDAPPLVHAVAEFFLAARALAQDTTLLDGSQQRVTYSLRTLSRALSYARDQAAVYGLARALHDGFATTFATPLLGDSHTALMSALNKSLPPPGKKVVPRRPAPADGESRPMMLFHGFWIAPGPLTPSKLAHFVMTATVEGHLTRLARAVVSRKLPVLLQGPTSAGKTTIVEYLAAATGHRFVRINNHEHTDLQEYLGSYQSNAEGRLVFQEGVLVDAVRNGHWLVLDELNLAPTEVLEALNRLLDDNRELFIPETQETVRPHPHFMLFATQNPPMLYGGRKVLSRALRNRFLELHMDDILPSELALMLQERGGMAPSHATKLVAVMQALHRRRQASAVFSRHAFLTARDLFRWAARFADADPAQHWSGDASVSYMQMLAEAGYMLLAERLRSDAEKDTVADVLEAEMKVRVQPTQMYAQASADVSAAFPRLVWTSSMRRMLVLVQRCIVQREPVLLVGETGCGKTTIVQVCASLASAQLYMLNCHANTETSDLLGGLRPVRGRAELTARLVSALAVHGIHADANDVASVTAAVTAWAQRAKKLRAGTAAPVPQHDAKIDAMIRQWRSLFHWVDGPLVQAMRTGGMLLLDEISLAEDSVLERLNSVLESSRTLLLAEKGGEQAEEIVAHADFHVFATMNPGGDYGKKELSPALRNRMTEIWIPALELEHDYLLILRAQLANTPDLAPAADAILATLRWLAKQRHAPVISLRDVTTWVAFLQQVAPRVGLWPGFLHGACLVFLDGFGERLVPLRQRCWSWLLKDLIPAAAVAAMSPFLRPDTADLFDDQDDADAATSSEAEFRLGMFSVPRGPHPVPEAGSYSLEAPTTHRNARRILRALQMRKPLLLEGSPGVGKTTLVCTLGALTGHRVVRINLSEQTDIADLFGSDMPVEGGRAGEFRWCDGALLAALRAGDWVLLDELNLASQSVLEGLNACLDHRASVFVPELNRTFDCSSKFRIFACQNPMAQGGGRRGLPKSFLNRFSLVWMDPLTHQDMSVILGSAHASLSADTREAVLRVSDAMLRDSKRSVRRFARQGAPWEFNLRDVFRWCCLTRDGVPRDIPFDVVYLQRFRTREDRVHAAELFRQCFGRAVDIATVPRISLTPTHLVVGDVQLQRISGVALRRESNAGAQDDLQLLARLARPLQALMVCVQQGWLSCITGASGTGKTAVVRLLARLTGHTLREFAMNPSVDTMELLGSFEQVDLTRHLTTAAAAVTSLVHATCQSLLPQLAVGTDAGAASALAGLIDTAAHASRAVAAGTGGVATIVPHLTSVLDCVRPLCPHTLRSALADADSQCAALLRLHRSCNGLTTGRFEWVDGLLLQAIQRGDWVLIDNVNMCNPTVLDRLNPLLEPDGVLVVNERGADVVLKPHPDFRLFFTMDPQFGEVSRAMRNRGIEIALLPEPRFHRADMALVMRSRSFVGAEVAQDLPMHKAVEWMDLLMLLLQRGVAIGHAWAQAWAQVFPQLELPPMPSLATRVPGLAPVATRSASFWCRDSRVAGALRAAAMPMHWLVTAADNQDDVRSDLLDLPLFWAGVLALAHRSSDWDAALLLQRVQQLLLTRPVDQLVVAALLQAVGPVPAPQSPLLIAAVAMSAVREHHVSVPGASSLLAVSAQHADSADVEVSHQAVPLLLPWLRALDSVLVSDAAHADLPALALRHAVWRIVTCSSAGLFPIGEFAALFRLVHVEIAPKLDTDGAAVHQLLHRLLAEHSDALRDAGTLLRLSSGDVTPADSRGLLHDLLQLQASLFPWREHRSPSSVQPSHPAVFVPTATLAAVVKAVATVFCRPEEAPAVLEGVVPRLHAEMQAAETAAAASSRLFRVPSAAPKTDWDSDDDEDVAALALHDDAQLDAAQADALRLTSAPHVALWPLRDWFSLQAEANVVAAVLAAPVSDAARAALHRFLHAEPEEMPVTAAAAQAVAWATEHVTDAPETPARALLPSLVLRMELDFHQRVWRNAFAHSLHRSLAGPARLFQAGDAMILLRLLGSGWRDVPLVAHRQREVLLRQLQARLCRLPRRDDVDARNNAMLWYAYQRAANLDAGDPVPEDAAAAVMSALGESMPRDAAVFGIASARAGYAWAILALHELRLARPLVVDPAVEQATRLDVLRARHAYLAGLHRAACDAEAVAAIATRPDAEREAAEAEIAQLQAKIDGLHAVRIVRPAEPSYPQLLRHVDSALTVLLAEKRVRDLLAGASSPDAETAWQDGVASWMQSTQDRYLVGYSDVVLPFLVAVSHLRYGLRCVAAARARVASQTLPGHQAMRLVTTLLVAPGCGEMDVVSRVQHVLTLLAAAGDHVPAARRLAVLHASLGLLHTCEATDEVRRVAHQLFLLFTETWTRAEAKARADAAAAAEEIKTKTSVYEAADEAAIERAQLAQTFPDYMAAFADLSVEDAPDTQPDQDAVRELSDSAAVLLSDSLGHSMRTGPLDPELVHAVCRLHAASQSSHRRAADPSAHIDAFASVYDACSGLWPDLMNMPMWHEAVVMPAAHAVRAGLAVHQMQAQARAVATRDGDFYRDANVAEARLAEAPLLAVLERVQQLLQEWPDHALLVQLARITHRVLHLAVAEPLMKFITGVEVLLRKGQEWQALAARHVSLAPQLDELSRLIIRWRKLELDSWPSILSARRRAIEASASRWWFHVANAVRSCQEGTSSREDLGTLLDQFLRQSSIGEFRVRLGFIAGFAADPLVDPDIAMLLRNLHDYYAQFSSAAEERIEKDAGPVRTALTEFIKLVRWDTNQSYYGLRSAVDKSHRKLNKLANDYTTVLRQALGVVLVALDAAWSATEYRDVANAATGAKLRQIRDAGSLASRMSAALRVGEAVRPDLLPASAAATGGDLTKVSDGLVRRVRQLCIAGVTPSDASMELTSPETLHDLCSTIIDRARDLAGMSEKKTRPVKEKALRDLWEALREEIGVSPSILGLPETERTAMHALLTLPKLPQSDDPAMQPVLQHAQQSTVRILQRLVRLRVAVAGGAHASLPSRDASRALAFAEQLWRQLARARGCVADHSADVARLRRIAAWLPRAGDHTDWLSAPVWDATCRQVVSGVDSLRHALAGLSASLDAAGHSVLVPRISELLVRLGALGKAALAVTPVGGGVPAARGLIDAVVADVRSCVEEARALISASDDAGVRYLPALFHAGGEEVARTSRLLEQSIALAERDYGDDAAVGAGAVDAAKIGDAIVRHVMLGVQSVHGRRDAHRGTWVGRLAFAAETLALLHLPDLLAMFDRLFALPRFAGDAAAVAQFVAPLVAQFTCSARVVWSDVCLMYAGGAKLTSVVLKISANLVTHGFCISEQEEESEEAGDDELGTGTGMGEGQGEKDVSDQIEDEEQLLGTQDQQQQEERAEPNKKDDKDDGMEMKNDFDGDMFDVEQQDDDENQDDNDEDEDDEPELDREMGETNPEMDEAIDERLWNEDDDQDDGADGEQPEDVQDKQAQGGDAEMVAKDENDDDDDTGDADDKEKQGKDQDDDAAQQKQQQSVDEQADGENEEDDKEAEDEGPRAEPEANTLEPDTEHTFELPDDLTLGDDDDDDDGEGEEDPGADNDPGDDNDDQGDDDAEDAAADRAGEVSGDDAEDASDNGQEDVDTEEQKNDDEAPIEPEAAAQTAPQPEKSAADDDADDDGDDGEDDEQDPVTGMDTDEERTEANAEDAYGVEESMARPDAGVQPEDQTAQARPEDDDDAAAPNEEQDAAASLRADRDGEQISGSAAAQAGGEAVDQQPAPSRQIDPNPFRSLGDARKQWKTRLQLTEDAKHDDKEAAGVDEEDGHGGAQDEYRFVQDEEAPRSSDQQVLASATVEQAAAMQAPEDDEDEAMRPVQDDEDEDAADRGRESKPSKEDDDDEAGGDVRPAGGLGQRMIPEEAADDRDSDVDDDKAMQDSDEAEDVDRVHADDESGAEDADAERIVTRDELLERVEDEDAPMLGSDEIARMRAELEEHKARLAEEQRQGDEDAAAELWASYEALVSDLVMELCEKLRLLLEPTIASKLKGDYRTGKRINMKKVIPFIASQFRKDKIWLRRTKPHRRNFQIMLAIDDSLSMADNHAGQLACESLCLLATALTRLEAGQLSVVSFGGDSRILLPFQQPFTRDVGAQLLQAFQFAQQSTDVPGFLSHALGALAVARQEAPHGGATRQLLFIISDGRLGDRAQLRERVQRARDQDVLPVFIILDNPDARDSILRIQTPVYEGGKLRMVSYLDSFPFPYYVVLRRIEALPEILAEALRQWFEIART